MANLAPRELLLSGYYGFGNVGDDALLEALAPALHGLGVETIYVPAGDPSRLPTLAGLVPLGRNDVRGIWRRLRAGAALFSGGGGLLQNATSARSLVYYLGLLGLARAAGRPYAIGCQSIGPLTGGLARAVTARVVRGAAAIAVRDAGSRDALVGLGVPAERVELAADPAFLLAPPQVSARHGVGVCLRRTAHTARVVGAVRDWLPTAGEARLIACNCGDHALHAELGAAECVWPAGVQPMLAALAGCEVVVSERLHPLIFAALAGVPAVAIDYDPKVAGLAADLGLPVAGRDADLTADGLAAAVAQLGDLAAAGARLQAAALAARERVQRALANICAALA